LPFKQLCYKYIMADEEEVLKTLLDDEDEEYLIMKAKELEKTQIASEMEGFNIKKVICPFCKASNIIGDKQTKTLCAICGEEFKTQAKYF